MNLHWAPNQVPIKLAESLETGALKISVISNFSTTLSCSYKDNC